LYHQQDNITSKTNNNIQYNIIMTLITISIIAAVTLSAHAVQEVIMAKKEL